MKLRPPDVIVDFRNNLIYNAGGTTNLGSGRRNVINNYYKNGPDTDMGMLPMRIKAKPGKGPRPTGFTSGIYFRGIRGGQIITIPQFDMFRTVIST